jgi:hypothetical protein
MVGQVTTSLLTIPGVGPSIAADLNRVGIREVAELRARNPESLYADLCRVVGHRVDRCVLYVFRCAVYYASESQHDPELLKWWNWKDPKFGRPRKTMTCATTKSGVQLMALLSPARSDAPSPAQARSHSDNARTPAINAYPPRARSPVQTPPSRDEIPATRLAPGPIAAAEATHRPARGYPPRSWGPLRD